MKIEDIINQVDKILERQKAWEQEAVNDMCLNYYLFVSDEQNKEIIVNALPKAEVYINTFVKPGDVILVKKREMDKWYSIGEKHED